MEISPAQCRAARGLVAMTQRELAAASRVSLRTITSFEAGGRAIPATIAVVQQALEAAGVVFIPSNGGGPGVRLSG